jgi:uncharacterized membrane protein
MNAEQKRAWLAVVSGCLCVVGFGILALLFNAKVAVAAFAFYGLNGFGTFIGRREKLDERDLSIARRATLAGGILSYTVFVFALMAIWTVVFLLRGQEQVSVHALPMVVMFGAIVLYLGRGITLLALYRRHAEADDV